MSTVYAAFDNHQAVDGAVAQLLSHGFPRSSINFDADRTFRDSPLSLRRDTGILSKVESFFAKLTNPTTVPGDLYEEIIRRGGVVVAVAADTAIEEQTALALLRNAGSIDLASRIASREKADSTPVSAAGSAASDIEPSDRAVAVGGLPLHKYPADSPVQHGTDSGYTQASEADFKLFQPGTYEIREQVEVITLKKTVRVVEELEIKKSVTVYSETINDMVRGTAVDLEKIAADRSAAPLLSASPTDLSR